MPEILGWCNTRLIRTNNVVGALPQNIYPARTLRADAVAAFDGGGYSLPFVRFLGYWEYGTGAENVPPLLLSVNAFHRVGMNNDNLKRWAQNLAERAGEHFSGLHVIVKIQAGNCSGFGEVYKPDQQPT